MTTGMTAAHRGSATTTGTTVARRVSPAAATRRDRAVARPVPPATAGGRATTSASVRRRRLAAVLAMLVLTIVLTVAVGRVGASAQLADPVAGHAVVAPGDTLWDIAVETAPDGVDPREQLAAIRGLNGLDSSAVAPWSVVLLPAR